jgi:hypothetical protein
MCMQLGDTGSGASGADDRCAVLGTPLWILAM